MRSLSAIWLWLGLIIAPPLALGLPPQGPEEPPPEETPASLPAEQEEILQRLVLLLQQDLKARQQQIDSLVQAVAKSLEWGARGMAGHDPRRDTKSDSTIDALNRELMGPLKNTVLGPLAPNLPQTAAPPPLSPTLVSNLRQAMANSPLLQRLVYQNPHLREEIVLRAHREALAILDHTSLEELALQQRQRGLEEAQQRLSRRLHSNPSEKKQAELLAKLQEVEKEIATLVNRQRRENDATILWAILYSQTGLLAEHVILYNNIVRFLKEENNIYGALPLDSEIYKEATERYIHGLRRFHERAQWRALVVTSALYKNALTARLEVSEWANRIRGTMAGQGKYFGVPWRYRFLAWTWNTGIFSASLFAYESFKASLSDNPLYKEAVWQEIWSWPFQVGFVMFGAAAQTVGIPVERMRAAMLTAATAKAGLTPPLAKISAHFLRNLPLVAGAAVNHIVMLLMTLPAEQRQLMEKAEQQIQDAKTAGEMEAGMKTQALTTYYLHKMYYKDLPLQLFKPATYVDLILGAELNNLTFAVVGRAFQTANQAAIHGIQNLYFKPAIIRAAVERGVVAEAVGSEILSGAASAATRREVFSVLISEGLILGERRGAARLVLTGISRTLGFLSAATPQGRGVRFLVVLVGIIATETALHSSHTITFFAWIDLAQNSAFKSADTFDLLSQTKAALAKYQQTRLQLAQRPEKEPPPPDADRAQKEMDRSREMFNAAMAVHRFYNTYRLRLRAKVQDIFNTSVEQYSSHVDQQAIDQFYIDWLFSGGRYDPSFRQLDQSLHPPLEKLCVPHPCYEYTAVAPEILAKAKREILFPSPEAEAAEVNPSECRIITEDGTTALRGVLVPPSELFDYFKTAGNAAGSKEQMSQDWFLFSLFAALPELGALAKGDPPRSWCDMDWGIDCMYPGKLDHFKWPSPLLGQVKNAAQRMTRDEAGFQLQRLIELREKIRRETVFPQPPPSYPIYSDNYRYGSKGEMARAVREDRSVKTPKFVNDVESCTATWDQLVRENDLFLNGDRRISPAYQEWLTKTRRQLNTDLERMVEQSQVSLRGLSEQLFTAPQLIPGKGETSAWSNADLAIADFMTRLLNTHSLNEAYTYASHDGDLYAKAKNLPRNLLDSYAQEFSLWANEVGILLADSRYRRRLIDQVLTPLQIAFKEKPAEQPLPDINSQHLLLAKQALAGIVDQEIIPRLAAIRERGEIPPTGLVVGCLLIERLLTPLLNDHFHNGTYYAFDIKAQHLTLLAERGIVNLPQNFENGVRAEQWEAAQQFGSCTDAAYGTEVGFIFAYSGVPIEDGPLYRLDIEDGDMFQVKDRPALENQYQQDARPLTPQLRREIEEKRRGYRIVEPNK